MWGAELESAPYSRNHSSPRPLRFGCLSQIGSSSLWSLWAKGWCGGQPCGRRSPSTGVVHGRGSEATEQPGAVGIVHKSTGDGMVSQLHNHLATNSLRKRATASGFRPCVPSGHRVSLGLSNFPRVGSAKSLRIQVRPCRSKSDPTSQSRSVLK